MFKKILIANRGEIACRIIKTAKKMGILTVAVYSEADREALYVDMADEAVLIGPAPSSESYLVIDKIIDACLQTGAEAVHPGYGFLSEREEFSRLLSEKGIVFIGPNPKAIAAMGDKIESKKVAANANVSTVPGYLGVIETSQEALRIAKEIGFPVIIKASAGGGGKGMRIAISEDEVAEGFERARSEAASSFGDDRVFIEKYIVNPRHIEIQVLGDKHGNIIHLGERECSIQRRNQKVIEEAPSPLLDDATRTRMGAQAVALAKAVGYDSAGTVEFVAGQDRSFYFLEMNTRLQVEHPVTEMITGIDLVEEMIRIAYGEHLRYKQKDIRIFGWAIESRIYAEDPVRGFLPSTGRLVTYRPPEEGWQEGNVTVRNDSGAIEGGMISMYYDPMIAKLITHAPTREAAIDAQSVALDSFAIEGIRHNIPFLSVLMKHPRWRSARLSTGFIAEEFPDGFIVPTPKGDIAISFVAIGALIHHLFAERRRHITGKMRPVPPGFNFEQDRFVKLGEDIYEVEMESGVIGDTIMTINGHYIPISSKWRPGDPVWKGTVNGVKVSALVRRILNGVHLSHGGLSTDVHVYTARQVEFLKIMPPKIDTDTGKQLICPMPGLIKTIYVQEGSEIRAGDPLCIVEAMKMENVMRAERDAVVTKIFAEEGKSMAVDEIIMEFE